MPQTQRIKPPAKGFCIDCGKAVELSDEAWYWLHQEQYVDPDVLDYDNNGMACEVTGDVHLLTNHHLKEDKHMQPLSFIREIADQAQAENSSGVIAGDEVAQAYLDGVEQALRWAAGDGTTEEFAGLLRRAAEAAVTT